MKQSRSIRIALFVAMLIVLPLGIYYSIEGYYAAHRLGYYGPDEELPDGTIVHHTVSPFSFVDQEGDTITETVLKGHVSVVNFFFVACPGICPKMNSQLKRVHDKYLDNDRVAILSHSVDPQRDTVPVLHAYSQMFDADHTRWHFLTGKKKAIYLAARNSYMVNTLEGDGGPTDFIHSEYLVLVDPELHIRGYYEGTHENQVDDLMHDMDVLLRKMK